jgi:GntR family transcriptional regulator, carbon starvation induced regulator
MRIATASGSDKWDDLQVLMISDTESEARTLTTRIYRELRADIITCRLNPGEKVRIATVKDRYGSSLSAAREAMTRLAAEGWLTSEDQKGFSVAGVSRSELADLFLTRTRIECLALEQAIAAKDRNWEADVITAYGDLVRHQGQEEAYWLSDNWVASHNHFHRVLIAGCRSPSLIAIAENLAQRSQRYRYLSTVTPSHRDGSGEHRKLFEAVLAHDTIQGQAILTAHYETTAEILMSGDGLGKPTIDIRQVGA